MSIIVSAVSLCLINQATTNEDPLRLRIRTVDAQALDIELTEITEQGRVRYPRKGRAAEIRLDDLLQIVPQHKIASAPGGVNSDARTLYLTDGGVLRGIICSQPNSAARTIHVDIGDHIVTVPFEALAAVRAATTKASEVEREFQRRITERKPGRDTMIIAKSNKPVVVQGSLEQLGPDGWEFRFGTRTRSDGLDKVYGFVLGASPVEVQRLPVTIMTNDDNRFTARILSADNSNVKVDAGPIGQLTLPWRRIRTVNLQSDRIVYLSDLEPLTIEQNSMTGTSWPLRRDKNVTGGPIQMGRRVYAKGLGVHANSVVTYKLDGRYERFSAIVGIDHTVAPYGSVVFRVKADGKRLYESKIIHGDDAPETISVYVSDAKQLTLECDMSENLDLSDHANWANAMLIRARGKDKPGGGV